MELYYTNETLYVDVDSVLDESGMRHLKRRVFRIVDDYDIDRIVFQVRGEGVELRKELYKLENEYHQRYHGTMMIR